VTSPVAPTVHLLPDKVGVAIGVAWTHLRTQLGRRPGIPISTVRRVSFTAPACFSRRSRDPVDLTEAAFVDRPAAPRDEIVLELLRLPG
jgi:hypothetical protein